MMISIIQHEYLGRRGRRRGLWRKYNTSLVFEGLRRQLEYHSIISILIYTVRVGMVTGHAVTCRQTSQNSLPPMSTKRFGWIGSNYVQQRFQWTVLRSCILLELRTWLVVQFCTTIEPWTKRWFRSQNQLELRHLSASPPTSGLMSCVFSWLVEPGSSFITELEI